MADPSQEAAFMPRTSFFARQRPRPASAPAPLSGSGVPTESPIEEQKTEEVLEEARAKAPPPRRMRGGACPPAALATLHAKLATLSAPKPLTGGAGLKRRRDSALVSAVTDPTDALPTTTYQTPATNNGITTNFMRHFSHQALEGGTPNVTHGYAPVGASYNATGLPGSVPPTWRQGLGTTTGNPYLAGPGEADVGVSDPGQARRIQAAQFCGAGFEGDSDDDSYSSDSSLEGGRLSVPTLRSLIRSRAKALERLKKQKRGLHNHYRRQKALDYRYPWEAIDPPFQEDTLRSKLRREIRKQLALEHGIHVRELDDHGNRR